jgi:hypothetical protein
LHTKKFGALPHPPKKESPNRTENFGRNAAAVISAFSKISLQNQRVKKIWKNLKIVDGQPIIF